MSRLRYLATAALAALLVTSVGRTDAPKPAEKEPPKPKEKPVKPLGKGHELMVAKLKESQNLLQWITLGDFPKIEKSALALSRIGQAAEFLNAGKSTEYELQIALLQRSADKIAEKAKDKNLDGVMLNYIDMTMTCVKCHQHTRGTTPDARLPGVGPNYAGK